MLWGSVGERRSELGEFVVVACESVLLPRETRPTRSDILDGETNNERRERDVGKGWGEVWEGVGVAGGTRKA